MLAAMGAASAAEPVQKVKPPVAQVWIDLATISGGMPAMPTGGVSGMVGSLFGGGSASAKGNVFGFTQNGGVGRWMDVTLLTHKNPGLMNGQQAAPVAAKFGGPL